MHPLWFKREDLRWVQEMTVEYLSTLVEYISYVTFWGCQGLSTSTALTQDSQIIVSPTIDFETASSFM